MSEDYKTKCEDLKTLDSGAKRDNSRGKGAYELISPMALKRLALVYERGAIQKGARNWEKGIPFSRCMQSAMRHLQQHLEGLKDEDHLAQSAWNIFALIHFEEMIEKGLLPKELNDLPNYNNYIKKNLDNKEIKFYLAHPFDSRRKVREWETKFEEKTGIKLINPFYDVPDRPVPLINEDATRYDREGEVKKFYREIVDTDLREIKNSNGIIAVVDESLSYGTIQEIVYAKKIFGKRVFLVISNGHKDHPWLKYHADKIFTSLEEFEEQIEWVKAICLK